jgi:hypothetical protein
MFNITSHLQDEKYSDGEQIRGVKKGEKWAYERYLWGDGTVQCFDIND